MLLSLPQHQSTKRYRKRSHLIHAARKNKSYKERKQLIKQAQQQRLFNPNHRRLAIPTIAKFERWQTGCTRLLQQHLGANRAIVFFPEQ
jgi:hypothetical protein